MINVLKRALLSDRKNLTIIILILIAVVVNITTFIRSSEIRNEIDARKPEISDMRAMADEALKLKRIVRSKEKKILLSKASGIVSTMEQMLKDIGLKAQVLKPLDKKKVNGFTEEKAELEIQDTDLNSIVNLLYKVENSPVPLKITSASLKTTFEDPDKFIFKMTLSLMGKG